MTTKFSAYFCVMIILCIAVVGSAQTDDKKSDKNIGQVSVKDDEFTGKRKVTLKKLSLAENLTLSLETEADLKSLSGNQSSTGRARAEENFRNSLADATVTFIVAHPGAPLFLGDRNRFDFMIDGARVEGNFAGSLADFPSTNGKEEVISVVNLDTLAKVVRGRDVKMKLGDQIYTIDSSAKDKIKEFLKAVGR